MGGMTCTVCRHEAREAVDAALVAGEPLRDIAGRSTIGMTMNRYAHVIQEAQREAAGKIGKVLSG